MTDDSLDDTQQLIQSKGYQDALKEGLEAVLASVGKMEIELLDTVAKNIWNAAIEEAAKWLETANRNDTDDAKEIRKLKK